MQHNQSTNTALLILWHLGTAMSTDAEVGWAELGLFGRHLQVSISTDEDGGVILNACRPGVCHLWTVSCGYYQHMLWNGFTCSYLESFTFSWKARCARSLKIPPFFLLSHYLERKGRNFEIFNAVFNPNLVIEKFLSFFLLAFSRSEVL